MATFFDQIDSIADAAASRVPHNITAELIQDLIASVRIILFRRLLLLLHVVVTIRIHNEFRIESTGIKPLHPPYCYLGIVPSSTTTYYNIYTRCDVNNMSCIVV